MATPTTHIDIPQLFYLPIVLRDDSGCNMREVLDLFKEVFLAEDSMRMLIRRSFGRWRVLKWVLV
jgi:hypothetical protein